MDGTRPRCRDNRRRIFRVRPKNRPSWRPAAGDRGNSHWMGLVDPVGLGDAAGCEGEEGTHPRREPRVIDFAYPVQSANREFSVLRFWSTLILKNHVRFLTMLSGRQRKLISRRTINVECPVRTSSEAAACMIWNFCDTHAWSYSSCDILC